MAKRYIRLNFENAPSVKTPLSADTMNHIDKGIDDLDIYKVDTDAIANNLVTTEAGLVLDARQGKVLDDKVNTINNNLAKINLQLVTLETVVITSRLICTKKANVIKVSGNLVVDYSGDYTSILSGFPIPPSIIDGLGVAYAGTEIYPIRLVLYTTGTMQLIIPNITTAKQITVAFNFIYDL